MSEPYWSMPDIHCPFCKAKDQDVEDLGDHPSYLSGTCSKCGKDFSVDIVMEEYYDEAGRVVG